MSHCIKESVQGSTRLKKRLWYYIVKPVNMCSKAAYTRCEWGSRVLSAAWLVVTSWTHLYSFLSNHIEVVCFLFLSEYFFPLTYKCNISWWGKSTNFFVVLRACKGNYPNTDTVWLASTQSKDRHGMLSFDLDGNHSYSMFQGVPSCAFLLKCFICSNP